MWMQDGITDSNGYSYYYFVLKVSNRMAFGQNSRCTHAIWKDKNGTAKWENGYYTNAGSGYFEVYTQYTIDEWIEYIKSLYNAGNPVKLIYIPGTVIETPIPPEELEAYRARHMNYPTTTTYTDSDVYMKQEYVADTKLYIDNKIQEVLSNVAETQTLLLTKEE